MASFLFHSFIQKSRAAGSRRCKQAMMVFAGIVVAHSTCLPVGFQPDMAVNPMF
jgi:hypothetical protein